MQENHKKAVKTSALALILIFAWLIPFGVTWTLIDLVYQNQILLAAALEALIAELEQQIQNQNLGLTIEIHVTMNHYRGGQLIATSHHAGTLTNNGADFIEGKISDDTPFANVTDYAVNIALSNSTTSPAAGWNIIPSEITTGGMSRAGGTYVSTGVGTWNVSYTFSPSETNSCRLTGLYWDTGVTHSLLAADTITAINYESGDSVEIIWSITVS